MKVYIVSWGFVQNDRPVEIDSIVHEDIDDAREEFDLVNVQAVLTGRFAEPAKHGCPAYVRLEEVEMLDEAEKPTPNPQLWVYDGERTVLQEKRSE